MVSRLAAVLPRLAYSRATRRPDLGRTSCTLQRTHHCLSAGSLTLARGWLPGAGPRRRSTIFFRNAVVSGTAFTVVRGGGLWGPEQGAPGSAPSVPLSTGFMLGSVVPLCQRSGLP